MDPYYAPGQKKPARRCLCCSLYTCIYLICCIVLLLGVAAIVCALLLFKAPTITVQSVNLASNGALPVFEPDPSTIGLNLTLIINVDNPNVIGATLQKIIATGQSPSLPNVDIANGEVDNVTIGSKANTTINFPLTVEYSSKTDPNSVALKDLITRCGLTGQAKQKIPLNYKIATTLSVFNIGIGLPAYTSSTSFDCPIPAGFNSALVSQLIASMKG